MKKAFLVAGLLFGDEGKGATVDYLTRKHGASLIVKYNGGPQNAHNVVTPLGVHHTFAQFGSGSFVPGVRTHISKYALYDPLAAVIEGRLLRAKGLTDIFDRLTVSGDTVVITPFHAALNRMQELSRGAGAHGSTGVGLGIARQDSIRHPGEVLRMKHLINQDEVMKRLKFIEDLHRKETRDLAWDIARSPDADAWERSMAQRASQWFDNGPAREYLWSEYSGFPKETILHVAPLEHLLKRNDVVIFEGSQGVLLDEQCGYQPHVTWTDTTFNNALDLLHHDLVTPLPSNLEVIRVGALRPYATRHGAGPLPRESFDLRAMLPEIHNETHPFAGSFRLGHLDLALVAEALVYTGGVDELAVSSLDRLASLPQLTIYDLKGRPHVYFTPSDMEIQTLILDFIEDRLGVPVTVMGFGPTAFDRYERMPRDQKKAA